jgi:hypothetical protein
MPLIKARKPFALFMTVKIAVLGTQQTFASFGKPNAPANGTPYWQWHANASAAAVLTALWRNDANVTNTKSGAWVPTRICTIGYVYDGRTCRQIIDGAEFTVQHLDIGDTTLNGGTLFAWRRTGAPAAFLGQNSLVGDVVFCAGPVSRQDQNQILTLMADYYNLPRVQNYRKTYESAQGHHAFPDIANFQGYSYFCFRESEVHDDYIGPTSGIRVLRRRFGARLWDSFAFFPADESCDYRDPHWLESTDDSWLQMHSVLRQEGQPHKSCSWELTEEGWTARRLEGEDYRWIFRRAYNPYDLHYYAASYRVGGTGALQRLYKGATAGDRSNWVTHVDDFFPDVVNPTETGLIFQADGRAVCIVRNEVPGNSIATAYPPYQAADWNYVECSARMDAPYLLDEVGPEPNQLLVAGRMPASPMKATFAWIDTETGVFTPIAEVPNATDGAYFGMRKVTTDPRAYLFANYSAHSGAIRTYSGELILPKS